MSELDKGPKGILRSGWTARVDEYAIAGAWACGDDVFVVGDATGSVYGFNGKSGAALWTERDTHGDGLLALAVHPNGATVATGGQDGCVHIRDARSGTLERTLDLGDGWVENLAWSHDGTALAASSGRKVFVDRGPSSDRWATDDHPSTVSAVVWSGAEELATASYSRVSFFDTQSGELQQKLEWKGSLVSMVLSPDGDIVACGSQDNSVHFWRRSTGKDSMMSGYPLKPASLSFDGTGTFLATGGSQSPVIWSFKGEGPEGTEPGVLELHAAPITELSFSRRGLRLASGDRDGAVVVWGVRDDGSGSPIGAALVYNLVESLSWRSDGRGLVALDAGGNVTSWRVKD